MPVEVNSSETWSPFSIAPSSTSGAWNIIVIAGHRSASTGPWSMVTVPAEASTDCTVPVADAVVVVAGSRCMSSMSSAPVAGAAASGVAGFWSFVSDEQPTNRPSATRVVIVYVVRIFMWFSVGGGWNGCERVRGVAAANTLREFPASTRSEEHTSELQSLMRNSYAVFCLKKKKHIFINSSYIKQ